jgi:large subunit ribosomal protein L3
MPARRRPGKGSKAYYPRKRARRIYPRIKTWPASKDAKPLGFAGYKAGMTHVTMINTNTNSTTKGQQISKAVTVLECPPISVFAFRCYVNKSNPFDVFSETFGKNLSRKNSVSKTPKKVDDQLKNLPKNISKINLMCNTNPVFKKKPEVFEIALGGSVDEQLKFAKEILGKDMKLSDVFKEGELVDVFAVTKGYGFEGPVRRFGVKTHGRKAQMMARHVGALGQDEPGRIRYTVPQSGQTGFQTRCDLNKRILKITNGFSVDGGFINYGNVKSDCLILEGCIPGSKKRLIRLRMATRPKKLYPIDIKTISTESKQGV